jgi:hypothetical protein
MAMRRIDSTTLFGDTLKISRRIVINLVKILIILSLLLVLTTGPQLTEQVLDQLIDCKCLHSFRNILGNETSQYCKEEFLKQNWVEMAIRWTLAKDLAVIKYHCLLAVPGIVQTPYQINDLH